MASLQLSGRVIHAPGPWGLDRPVKDAQIKVRDIDLPGRRDDLILEARTNDGGLFSGQSAEWRDRERIAVMGYTKEIDDPLDVPLLTVEVKVPAGLNFLSLPLPVAANSTAFEFPPVIVPWPPGGAPARLDDTDYWDPVQLTVAIKARVDQGKNFTVSLYGPDGDLVGADRADAERMLAWLAGREPHLAAILQTLLRSPSGLSKASDPATILAIAILVLVASVGTALVISSAAVGISLIVAILLGYDVSFSEETEVAADGTTRRRVKFTATKRSSPVRTTDRVATAAAATMTTGFARG